MAIATRARSTRTARARSSAPVAAPAAVPALFGTGPSPQAAATGGLNTRAMLVQLSMSCWTATVKDKKVTAEVAKEKKANKRSGKWTKFLMPKPAAEYDAVVSAFNALGNWNRFNTLPWGQDGIRILAASNFMPFAAGVRTQKDKIVNVLLPAFYDAYPRLCQEAATQITALGLLYDPKDYPTLDELREKFAIKTTIFPLPDAADFRVALADADVKAIRSEIEAEVKSLMDVAQQDVWARLYKVIKHMADRLSDKDATRLFDSMVENVRDMVAILPAINVQGDPKLVAARDYIDKKLCAYSTQDLREDEVLRTQVGQEARRIEERMRQFLPAID